MRSHLAMGVRAADITNRIKQCHTLLSAKQVSNEDLDQQLGRQTLAALVTPLEPIDQGFHAGSPQLHGMINCHAQIPSYHRGSFVKVSLGNEKLNLCGKVPADRRQCILPLALLLLFALVAHRSTHRCQEREKTTLWWVSLSVMLHYFPRAFSLPLHSHHRWHSGQPTGDACCYLLWLNNCMPAKSESGQ